LFDPHYVPRIWRNLLKETLILSECTFQLWVELIKMFSSLYFLLEYFRGYFQVTKRYSQWYSSTQRTQIHLNKRKHVWNCLIQKIFLEIRSNTEMDQWILLWKSYKRHLLVLQRFMRKHMTLILILLSLMVLLCTPLHHKSKR